MITIRKIFLLLVALVITSCASGPKFKDYQSSISTLDSNHGRIFVYRNSAFGAAVQPYVKLNGEKIGEAIAQGFFYVDRPAGEYEIMTSTEVDRKLSFILERGQTRYVRLGISIGFFVGHVYPELVDMEVGEKEILDCKFTQLKDE